MDLAIAAIHAHWSSIPVNIEAACENILAGTSKKVDAALCNDKPMILLAGIGFEADTIEDADLRLNIQVIVMSF